MMTGAFISCSAAVLAKGLREHAYAVDTASDGRQALDLAATNDYDLIVLDLLLPRIDGLEVCLRLRSDGWTTPILMLTARGEPDQRVEGLDVGADDYLPKPYHFPELLARVRALLRRGPALASPSSTSRILRSTRGRSRSDARGVPSSSPQRNTPCSSTWPADKARWLDAPTSLNTSGTTASIRYRTLSRCTAPSG
jgi:DNA-binding response OmpR family regulator